MLQMIQAGMNIARLNFSHGDFTSQKLAIDNLLQAARTAGKRLVIMADLPGPKMRIGQLAQEPIMLRKGDAFTLTIAEIMGSQERVSVSFKQLPQVVKAGDILHLNDGIIQVEVVQVKGDEVICARARG